jgi:hypothetical protein
MPVPGERASGGILGTAPTRLLSAAKMMLTLAKRGAAFGVRAALARPVEPCRGTAAATHGGDTNGRAWTTWERDGRTETWLPSDDRPLTGPGVLPGGTAGLTRSGRGAHSRADRLAVGHWRPFRPKGRLRRAFLA